ncbi:regulatory protein, luxR family [Sanguibacter gelidistatuariae]|uniref:Regulatory protein, luxR family n=1 Tax=Sanguibacter gelidistatuariae TaxID=1814289 RepID=A0A1G6WTS2_9MICO|nr:helix-turn-helix transcriptional regulator [Sanguibacter gelidistatuariae]SDD69288.1 regulatory protein, luxR family [Sanguibacter gelidistatuariae]
MVTATVRIRAREHIEALCHTATDGTVLRVALLGEIRRAIGFDAHVWVMTDPVTCVGSTPLAQIPTVRDLPRAIRSKYLTSINRWTTLASAASLGERREQSRLWTDVLSGYAIGDVTSSAYADRFGCWAFLDLWRLESSGPFSTADCTFLELTVLSQTVASEEWLGTLLPPAPGRSPIPAIAYNVAGQLLAHEQGVDDHRPSARAHLGEGFWVTARAARISENTIAVTLEESSPTDRIDLYARSFGLSARETELLAHLASGRDTREIAGHMSVSVNTVQDHLKSVFTKTGARSRTTLLGRALGFTESTQQGVAGDR